MKRLILLFALFALPLTARADEASRRAKAEQMIQLMHMDSLLTQMMDTMHKQFDSNIAMMGGPNNTPEQKAKLQAFMKQVFAKMDEQMSWKALEPEYVKMYAESFNDEELDAIIVFYKSPAGQSMITKMPELTQKGVQIAQSRLATLLPEIQKMAEDFAKENPPAAKAPAQ